MADYYDLSAGQRLSKLQQAFTKRLADKVRAVAAENGWTFHDDFGDRLLRDRIRCFYKTHLQNAKKRLATLQKHPNSVDHQRVLRVYLGSVRDGLTVEQSRRLEPDLVRDAQSRASASTASSSASTFSLDGSRGRRGEIFTDLQNAHAMPETARAISSPLLPSAALPAALPSSLGQKSCIVRERAAVPAGVENVAA
jgi:hypothetical protein